MGQSAGVAAAGDAHGFPAVLTSFIGRDGPVREVTDLLEESRLVTVTGSGGSGKTRLAGEVARRVAGRFADGVWLAELAPVQDAGHVPEAVAAALGVREQPGVPVAEALARVLARQQLLLVLDNCEHVIAAAAQLCAGLVAACDDLRVLATSREPLAIAGEARYRLGPLALPDPDDPSKAGGSEAVALFADRARRADARFVMGGQASLVVAEIVARLDGMPLAIELAAARVETLGVTGLLERIGDRFTLLASRDRLAVARHRSLAAAAEWSYQLLDDDQRRVFRWLSVFQGPFTLEAAEAVAGDGSGGAVLDLVDCSLLVPPQAGQDGRSRYGMLETLRAYGAGLLAAAGEQAQATARLAGYALRVAEQAAGGSGYGPASDGEVSAARWLDAEDATIRQVLPWALEHDPAAAARLTAALGWWWSLRGRLPTVYGLLREVTGRLQTGSEDWYAVQLWVCRAAFYSSDLDGGLDGSTVLRDAAAGRGPSRPLADGLAGRALALANLGQVAEAAGEAGHALAVAREIGYPPGEILALCILSFTAMVDDDLDRAVQLARQAARITVGVPGELVRWCSYALTDALIMAEDMAAADEVCTAGLTRSRDAGDVRNQLGLLPRMVILDLHAERIEDAAAHLREGIRIGMRDGAWTELFNCLEGCAYLCAATGRPAEAITMWAAFFTHLRLNEEGFPAEVRRREKPLRAARQAVGADRTRAAEERGTAMSLATAVEYALLLSVPEPPQAEAPASPPNLSPRERELVILVAQGRTDAQIAAQLFISIRTVRSHLDRIRDKTGCRRRADLTRLALREGLV
jgi:predicted ATPase/DNA-binding CsgD family transcriptional regulator